MLDGPLGEQKLGFDVRLSEWTAPMEREVSFYATPEHLTTVDAPEIETLDTDYRGLVRILRGLAVHELNASLYPVEVPSDPRLKQFRPASALLERVLEVDSGPLVEARPPQRRLVTYCRDLAVLATGLIRTARMPVRARCGFWAPEGEEERYFDHWWIQCWDGQRWVTIDTGRDAEVQDLDFDPDDLPPGRCVSGAEAWHLCRSGQVAPDRFGVAEYWGAWFVRGNVIRDLAALNKVELLPWDKWGVMDAESPLGRGPADQLVDEIADVVTADDWSGIRRLYLSHETLRPPEAMVHERVGSFPD